MRCVVLSAGLLVAGCSSDSKTAGTTTVASSAVPITTTAATIAPTTAAPTTAAPTTAAPTTAAPTTIAGAKPLPPIKVVAGTYRIDTFAVPYDITVVNDWTRIASTEKFMWLGRGANASTEFLVTSGAIPGSTPQEVLDGFCSGAGIDFVAGAATTVLGQPAVEQDGDTSNGCQNGGGIGTDVSSWAIPAGNTVRVIAADIGGKIVVIVADAPKAEWAALAPDVDAMVASMTLVG